MSPALNTITDHRSLFRQLLSGMYDAVIITDPNGHIIDQNERAREFFGYELEEILDRPIGVAIPGATPELVQRIREGLSKMRHVMLDANCLKREGVSFAAEVTVSAIDLVNPGDLVFTVRNTERRRRQIEAFRSKENCFKIAQTALFVCAPDGKFRRVNPAFRAMFGLEGEEEEVTDYSFADFMNDEPLVELFAKALSGETHTTRLKAENADGGACEELEITLAPDCHGKKIRGVVGSAFRCG